MIRPDPSEKGLLHYGIQSNGKNHIDFEVGPLSVAQWLKLQASEQAGVKATEVVAQRLVKLGDIPLATLTADYLEQNLKMPDLSLLIVAIGRLDERLESFRKAYEEGETVADGSGHPDGMVS